jgi:hypothetical protein
MILNAWVNVFRFIPEVQDFQSPESLLFPYVKLKKKLLNSGLSKFPKFYPC